MCSISVFPCLMTMVPNFTIIFIFSMFIFKFFFTNIKKFCIWSYFCCLSVNNFIFFFLKLTVSIASSLKDLQNFFMQSFPLYITWLFSMLLNDDIVDIEKPDGIYWLPFVVDELSGLLLHPSTFSMKHSRSA